MNHHRVPQASLQGTGKHSRSMACQPSMRACPSKPRTAAMRAVRSAACDTSAA